MRNQSFFFHSSRRIMSKDNKLAPYPVIEQSNWKKSSLSYSNIYQRMNSTFNWEFLYLLVCNFFVLSQSIDIVFFQSFLPMSFTFQALKFPIFFCHIEQPLRCKATHQVEKYGFLVFYSELQSDCNVEKTIKWMKITCKLGSIWTNFWTKFYIL